MSIDGLYIGKGNALNIVGDRAFEAIFAPSQAIGACHSVSQITSNEYLLTEEIADNKIKITSKSPDILELDGMLLSKQDDENTPKGDYFRYYSNDDSHDTANVVLTFSGLDFVIHTSNPKSDLHFLYFCKGNSLIYMADPKTFKDIRNFDRRLLSARIEYFSNQPHRFDLDTGASMGKYIKIDTRRALEFENSIVGFKDLGDDYKVIEMKFEGEKRGELKDVINMSDTPLEFQSYFN